MSVRLLEQERPTGMTNPFETLVSVGRELRFITSEEHKRWVLLRLEGAVRMVALFTPVIRARIDVELADYLRHGCGVVRDDLESVLWALDKGVQYAESRDVVETLRTLEGMLSEALQTTDAQLGIKFEPSP